MTLDTLQPTTYVELVNIAERGLLSILCDATHKDYFNAIKFVLSTLGKDRGYTMERATCWDVPGTTKNKEQLSMTIVGLNTNCNDLDET